MVSCQAQAQAGRAAVEAHLVSYMPSNLPCIPAPHSPHRPHDPQLPQHPVGAQRRVTHTPVLEPNGCLGQHGVWRHLPRGDVTASGTNLSAAASSPAGPSIPAPPSPTLFQVGRPSLVLGLSHSPRQQQHSKAAVALGHRQLPSLRVRSPSNSGLDPVRLLLCRVTTHIPNHQSTSAGNNICA